MTGKKLLQGYVRKSLARIDTLKILMLSFLLAGCSTYTFEINENQVYSPPTLYTNFELEDSALGNCITQTVRDKEITSSTDINQLQCSHSGIKTLSGINQFGRLQELGLKGNQISEIEELLQLTHLVFLDLSDNPVEDCSTLNQLNNLLDGNLIHNSHC